MKNIFKLMGLALIAGSMMFVACNKDENENNNSNNNQEPTYKVNVTWGTDTWGTDNIYWEQLSYQSGEPAPLFVWQAEKSAAATDPYCYGYTGDEMGTFTWDPNDETGFASYYDWFYFRNDDDYTEYNGKEYPTCQPSEFTTVISALDVTAATVSMAVTGKTFDLEAYLQQQTVETDMTVNVNNATWTVMED